MVVVVTAVVVVVVVGVVIVVVSGRGEISLISHTFHLVDFSPGFANSINLQFSVPHSHDALHTGTPFTVRVGFCSGFQLLEILTEFLQIVPCNCVHLYTTLCISRNPIRCIDLVNYQFCIS